MVFSSVGFSSSFAPCLIGFKNNVDQFSPAIMTQAPVPRLFRKKQILLKENAEEINNREKMHDNYIPKAPIKTHDHFNTVIK